jgi:uncharacterized protein (TIGR00266 family)
MKTEILQAPDFGMLRVEFSAPGQSVVAESGAMVSHTAGTQMQTAMRGGLLAAAKRKVLGGESIFQNTFTASEAGDHVFFAPPAEGDLQRLTLAQGEHFHLVSGAYVAHTGDITIDTKWQGVRSLFSGVGFFMLRMSGPGDVFYASYGAIEEIDVPAEGVDVDNGHIVGFGEGVDYALRKFGGYKSFFFGGEGLICRFSGNGKVLLQTRNVSSLVSFLNTFRPVKTNNS